MKPINCLWMMALIAVSGSCWAYGGGSSSSKACDKPKFTDFTPTENSEVAAGSAFSFMASKNTYPSTIKVNVKDAQISLKTDKKNDGTFSVNGRLPATVKGGFVRIAISADAQSNCKGTGGWLLKIKE